MVIYIKLNKLNASIKLFYLQTYNKSVKNKKAFILKKKRVCYKKIMYL
jgi:hypothetical protein